MLLSRLLPLGLAAGLLAPVAAAQTTHQVDLFSTTFVPKNLTVEVGDTVRWVWVQGVHNCVSGDAGAPDGIWDSGFGTDVEGFTFEITFDQAFLDANTVPGNRYDYYCTIHLPGMTGSITVEQPSNGQVNPYGSGVNAAGSLLTNTTPTIGQSLGVRLRNPDDPTAGPGVGILFLATQPDPNFPAGTVLPGYGLAPSPTGEILISLTPPDPAITLGPLDWTEGGNVDFFLPIPNDVNLIGRQLYAQGVLVDVTAPSPIGVTSAVELVIG